MNRVINKMGTEASHRISFWSRLSRGAITLLAVAGLAFAATSAQAMCGIVTGAHSKSPIKIPMLAQAGDDFRGFGVNESIVGLWHVLYTTSGGDLFNDTFDTWHADGTEFENAFLPPEAGNICYGVWKEIAPRTVKLHHIGWLFTPGSVPGTATGTFTFDETNTVSRDGKTYTGKFVFTMFGLDGTPSTPIIGTMLGTRITVD